jgi:hypothetical protein
MSETLEQQKEEIEALVSIYEGDVLFKQLNDTTFQYKVRKENSILGAWIFNKFIFISVWRGRER